MGIHGLHAIVSCRIHSLDRVVRGPKGTSHWGELRSYGELCARWRFLGNGICLHLALSGVPRGLFDSVRKVDTLKRRFVKPTASGIQNITTFFHRGDSHFFHK